MNAKPLHCVQLLGTPWTVACQAPLSMDSPGKKTEWLPCLLFQGIFPNQGLNPGLMSPVLAGGFLSIVPPGESVTLPLKFWITFIESLLLSHISRV